MAVDFETAWFPLFVTDKSQNRIIRKAASLQVYWNNLAVTGDYPLIKFAVSNDRIAYKIIETIEPDVGNNITDSILIAMNSNYVFIKIIFESRDAISGNLNLVLSYN
jgi:hypothetical protein